MAAPNAVANDAGLASSAMIAQSAVMSLDEDQIHPQAAVAPGYLANHSARVFNRIVDATLRPHGLSLALIGPIMLLSWKGPMLQRDLVRSSAIRQPAMVALLDKLEAAGLIRRSPAPTDRRAAMVDLTPAGHDAAALGGEALIGANDKGLSGFTRQEADVLVRLLQRLVVNLEDHAADP